MGKEAFLLYTEYQEEISTLSDEEAGRLFKAIYAHEAGLGEINLDGPEKILYSIFRRRLDENREKYRETCEKRKSAGMNGGRQKAANAKSSVAKSGKTGQMPPDNELELENELDNEPELENELEGQESKRDKDICAEPGTVSTPEGGAVALLPLNDRTEYPVTEEQCREWADLYPAVDVVQQLRNMRGWLLANPAKRKTRSGIRRFVAGWLAREQDRGGGKLPPEPRRERRASYDIDELERLCQLNLPEGYE